VSQRITVQKLVRFERKIFEELNNLIEHKNIIRLIKAQRLRWLGHVERMPEERDIKWELIASRPVGRPKVRWMDNVVKGIEAMESVNWERRAQDRNKWR
jgi:hypothetical protein